MGKITEELASEQEARDVAEAARESDWVEPSFLRELFLGRFRLDLINPFPPENEAEAENARPFMEKLRAVSTRWIRTRSTVMATSPKRSCRSSATSVRSASRFRASTAGSVFRR